MCDFFLNCVMPVVQIQTIHHFTITGLLRNVIKNLCRFLKYPVEYRYFPYVIAKVQDSAA